MKGKIVFLGTGLAAALRALRGVRHVERTVLGSRPWVLGCAGEKSSTSCWWYNEGAGREKDQKGQKQATIRRKARRKRVEGKGGCRSTQPGVVHPKGSVQVRGVMRLL